jgi:hypothetical protein
MPASLCRLVLLKLKPDLFTTRRKLSDEKSDNLEYCLLKVIHRIADMGLTIRQVFDKFDRNDDKTRKHTMHNICS